MTQAARERLGRFQQAVTLLLYEPQHEADFASDPQEWTSRWRLAGGDAAILRSLDPERLRYFYELQARDRTANVRSLFPLTVSLVGESVVSRYILAFPFGNDDWAVEAAQFSHYVRGTWNGATCLEETARDLVSYEAAIAEIRSAPLAPPPGAAPAGDDRVMLAPTARLLPHGADLPTCVDALREGRPLDIDRIVGTALLWRDADGDIMSAELDPDEAATLARLQTPAALGDLEAPGRILELWRAGVVVRADR